MGKGGTIGTQTGYDLYHQFCQRLSFGHIHRDLALGHPVLLICDECHHYQSRENRKIFSFLTSQIRGSGGYFALGLSATPFGSNNDSVLTRSLGKVIYQYDFSDAVMDGVISPFTICEVAASFYGDELDTYMELTDKISLLLARLYASYPSLKGMEKDQFLKKVSAIASEADMDPEEPAAAFLLATWDRKRVSNLARARISLIEHLDPETGSWYSVKGSISQVEGYGQLLARVKIWAISAASTIRR